MRLSSLTDYAISIMAVAASSCGAAALTVARLSESSFLPRPTVQKLVSLLVKADLLRSDRGAGGGIKLARPAAAISLADIIEAIEGPIALTQCVEHARPDCLIADNCRISPQLGQVNTLVRGALAAIALTQLMDKNIAAVPPQQKETA